MRKSGLTVGAIVVLALLVIGIVTAMGNNLMAILLPVVIIGGIFLLYKYPPSLMGGKQSGRRQDRGYQQRHKQRNGGKDRSRSKPMPFKVIEGGKEDNDDLPKYH
ncbi:hypothetical protein M6D81_15800 [Paenibacillus sp. J5C_2022]|uniref:hypothetical protein n=1 Tax=Paenibacillus sp. J5C2022 TaxID=2977129 RepID=UPI0021CF6327|nr:hypothetical protein [Paenibacillus sp. J5C2022]MCU6710162.1 hypothetical protein [Paenibacillus sp. J5C2022]